MYKNKDGKVIASLTEVKNKTGDIFAIVDEFGEISLTSYNKVRYKIIKVDIENTVSINQDGPDVQFATTEKKRSSLPEIDEEPEKAKDITPVEVLEVEEPTMEEETVPTLTETKEVEIAEEPNRLIGQLIDVEPWNRDGKSERQFSLNAVRPLIS